LATLTYDLAVVGRRVVESELASLERRFATHAKALGKLSTQAATAAARGQTQARKANEPRGPMYQPGGKEFLASLRAKERAELASQRKITANRVRQEREAARVADREAKTVANAKTSLDRQRSAALFQQHKEESRRAREIQERRATFIKSTVGNGAGRVVRGLAAVGTAGIAAAGIGGGAIAAASISQAMRLDEATRRLSIAGRGQGEAGADPVRMRRSFMRLGLETGVDPEQIAAGAGKFVAKTGDLATATANMRNFAITAQATGASIEDIASAGADLSEKFGIKSTEDMGKALAVLAMQGKKGAFELKDMAEQFPEMAAAAQRAGMKGVGGMRTLGGLAQIARQSTGSGSEASTALQMMLTQLVTKSDKLKSGEALGGEKVNVFEGGDPTKNARDIPTVLAEIVSRSKGNKQKLAKLFDIRGTRAMSPLIQEYQRTSEATNGTASQKQEAGKKAVLKYIENASAGSGDWSEVERDAKDAMKSFSVQINMAKQALMDALQSQLMPSIVRLIPVLSQLVPVVSTLVRVLVGLATFLAENPFTGLGAMLATSIAYEVGKAQLAGLLESAMRKSLGLPPVPGAPGGGADVPAGTTAKTNWVGAGATGLSLGMSVATMIVTAQVVNFEKGENDMTEAGKLVNRARELKKMSDEGPLTPEEQKEAREIQLRMNKYQRDAGKAGLGETMLSGAIDLFKYAGPVGWAASAMGLDSDKAAQSMLNANAPVEQKTMAGFSESVDRLVTAIDQNTAGQKSGLMGFLNWSPNRGDAPTGDIKNKK